jgi:hypothetical protein
MSRVGMARVGMAGVGIVRVGIVAVSVAVVVGLAALPSGVAGATAPRATPTPVVRIQERYAPSVTARDAVFTAGATVSPAPANPFDPAQASVRARFRAPDGSVVPVDAYWFQDFDRALVGNREVLTPRGTPYWKVRFTPTVAGLWWWQWDAQTTAGTATGRWHPLRVSRVAVGHGFLRVSPHDARYLAYDDGTPYFAIGENLGWYDARGTFAYDDWLDQLARQGVTWIRVWMPSWAMGIEWADTGLGDYTKRLDRGWQLDHVMDAAARRGIAVQLVLQNHGPFSTVFNGEWDRNPYNAANGGPLARPAQFFTDPVATELFRRRVRYIVARYGADTNLLAWELWNEVDLTDGYDSATSARWHRETADWLRGIDPARHLVTTSFALFPNDAAVWSQAGLDLTQLHFYSRTAGLVLLPDLANDVIDFSSARVRDYQRPVLFSELGVASSGPQETVQVDPEGIGVHDGLWAGAFGGGMGTAMPWWWDSVTAADPTRYYPMFGSVARFVRGISWDRAGFVASTATVTGAGGRDVRAHLLAGPDRALVWVKDHGVRYDAPQGPRLVGTALSLAGLTPGRWCAASYDTWAGRWTDLRVTVAGPAATLALPAFARDTAVRLQRC